VLEKKAVINDYACMFNKIAEFHYLALDQVEGYAIRKEHFKELLAGEVGEKYMESVSSMYRGII